MKKTLIALAAVSAVTAVSAQNVTLYGRLDASAVSQSSKIDGVKQYPATKTGIESSQLSTQFWGMRGSEDLGGGLKAEFLMQSNFNIDNGAVDTSGMFAREAWVGLSGGFGTVKLGRNYTAFHNLASATNHTFDTNINVTSAVFGNGLASYTLRIDNSVHYTTPTVSGLSAAISYGFGENKLNTADATNNTAYHVRYVNGPLQVGVAQQTVESRATGATVNSQDLKHNLIGGSYNFGVAALTGSYQTSKQGNTKDKGYQVGVSVPMGKLTLAAGYADSENKAGATKLDSNGYALLATYDLSKRTTAYAGYENTKVKTTTTSTTKTTNMAVGVRHTF